MSVEDSGSRRFESNKPMSFSQADLAPTSAQEFVVRFVLSFILFLWRFVLIASEQYIDVAKDIFEIPTFNSNIAFSLASDQYLTWFSSTVSKPSVYWPVRIHFGIHMQRCLVVSSICKYTKCECAAYDRNAKRPCYARVVCTSPTLKTLSLTLPARTASTINRPMLK